MRRKAVLLAVVLVAAACGAEGAAETTTTSAVEQSSTTSSSSTTTSMAETTTTTEAGPVELCGSGRPVRFESGQSYTADCFVSPLMYERAPAGWQTLEVTEEAIVLFRRVDVSGREVEVLAALVPYRKAPSGEAAAAITERDVLTLVGDPEPNEVAGLPGVVFDVLGEVGQDEVCGDAYRPVTGGGTSVHWSIAGSPSDKAPRGYGVGTCRIVRVWAVDLVGRTFLLIAGTEEPDDHEEAIVVAQDLVDSIRFEAP